MPRPKSDRRNELKSRVSDRVYDGLLQFMKTRGVENESDAIAVLLEFALFGMGGSDDRTKAILSRPLLL